MLYFILGVIVGMAFGIAFERWLAKDAEVYDETNHEIPSIWEVDDEDIPKIGGTK